MAASLKYDGRASLPPGHPLSPNAERQSADGGHASLPHMPAPGGLTEPLLDPMSGAPSSKGAPSSHAKRIAAAAVIRKDLGGKLWCAGAWLRLLTVLNGLALLAAVGYTLWLNGALSWLQDSSVDALVRMRAAITWVLPMGCGFGLLALEWHSACDEKATRRAMGCAFGGCGRCLLLLLCALVMAPLIHLHPTSETPDEREELDLVDLELLATAGATALTVLNALLEAWVLTCVPAYRAECYADFAPPKSKLHVDNSAYPQVYQRDEGAHLHLGVLLPGHASRDDGTLAMTANVDCVHLVGEVSQLDAPFKTVDESNASAGPFGPFERKVRLTHPIDISTPVEARVGHGIFEFRFLKGFLASEIPPSS